MSTDELRIECFVRTCDQRLDVEADQHDRSWAFVDALRTLGWSLIDTDEQKDKGWRKHFGDRRLFLCPFHTRYVGKDPEKLRKALP